MALTPAERKAAQRARERALLEPTNPVLRAAEDLIEPAVEQTLLSLDLGEGDAAAAQLARRLARIIDRAESPTYAARWLMPILLDCLTALQATPMSRKVAKQAPKGTSRLDELRMRRVQVPGHGA